MLKGEFLQKAIEGEGQHFPLSKNGSQIFACKLDNISKFRALLPECDPQRMEPTVRRQKNNTSTGQTQMAAIASNNTKSNNETVAKKNKKAPLFLAMASSYMQPHMHVQLRGVTVASVRICLASRLFDQHCGGPGSACPECRLAAG